MARSSISEGYVTLLQRISPADLAFGVNPIAPGIHGSQPPSGGGIFKLDGQQAFRLVSVDVSLWNADAVPTDNLVVLEANLAVVNDPSNDLTVKNWPFKQFGQPLGPQGISLHVSDEELTYWNDYLALGGMVGQVNLRLEVDFNNTDAVNDHSYSYQLTSLVELYQVKTSLAHVGFAA